VKSSSKTAVKFAEPFQGDHLHTA